MTIDVDALRRDYSVSYVASRLGLRLIKSGVEFKTLCPFHADHDPSMTINDEKGIFKCFSCGTGGDVIEFVAKLRGVEFKDACQIILGEVNGRGHAAAPVSQIAERPSPAPSTEIFLPPLDTDLPAIGKDLRTWNPKQSKWSVFRPSLVHVYRSDTGGILGVVIRVDTSPGYKITPTLRYVLSPDGEPAWALVPFDRPRPLYGLEMLGTEGPVLLVEGEKCVDAARSVAGMGVIGWPGGVNGIKYVDWSPLAGRDVILWGDADDPGQRCMVGDDENDGVGTLVMRAGARSVRVIPWQHEQAEGWDVADYIKEGASGQQIAEFIRQNARGWPDDDAPPAAGDDPGPAPLDARDRQEEPGHQQDPAPVAKRKKSRGEDEDEDPYDTVKFDDTAPFRILGYNHGCYFYHPAGSQQVVEIEAGAHTLSNLLRLAPIGFWEQAFPARGAKSDFHLSYAANALIRGAETVGIFNIDRLRGRGAWIDGGAPLVHVGDSLVVAGARVPLKNYTGHFIYERGDKLDIDLSEPATLEEARKLPKMLSQLHWEQPISATLLTGWCIVSMVCGALDFRPAVWVAGPSGSGKTTAIEHVIMRLLRSIAIRREGSTTEAHLRQSLFHDARPVIIDEAETEDKAAAARMTSVLQLARVSSTGGVIGKGGKDGAALEYTVRAAFCFSSINVNVAHYADESRISKLVLARNDGGAEDEQRFAQLNKDLAETLTPEYASRMFARAVQNLPTLLKNIKAYTDAAAATMKNRRAAQQIGTLLAGAHVCSSDGVISVEKAVKWIQTRQWGDFTALESPTDERRLITRLALNRRRVTTERGIKELTIGELIDIDYSGSSQDGVGPDDARRELGRVGILLKPLAEAGPAMVVANRSPEISRILMDSPWASDWSRSLRSMEGAAPCGTQYFSPGYYSRGVTVPLAALAEELG